MIARKGPDPLGFEIEAVKQGGAGVSTPVSKSPCSSLPPALPPVSKLEPPASGKPPVAPEPPDLIEGDVPPVPAVVTAVADFVQDYDLPSHGPTPAREPPVAQFALLLGIRAGTGRVRRGQPHAAGVIGSLFKHLLLQGRPA